MTTPSGDEIVNDFTGRGFGELAAPRKATSPPAAVPTKKPSRALVPIAARKPTSNADAPDSRRKRTREQRLVLALARLLAARMR